MPHTVCARQENSEESTKKHKKDWVPQVKVYSNIHKKYITGEGQRFIISLFPVDNFVKNSVDATSISQKSAFWLVCEEQMIHHPAIHVTLLAFWRAYVLSLAKLLIGIGTLWNHAYWKQRNSKSAADLQKLLKMASNVFMRITLTAELSWKWISRAFWRSGSTKMLLMHWWRWLHISNR